MLAGGLAAPHCRNVLTSPSGAKLTESLLFSGDFNHMKTICSFHHRACQAAALALVLAAGATVRGQNGREDVHARGTDLKGADVRGGTVTGGTVTGGTVTPGTVSPGTVTASANGRQIQVIASESASVNVNGSNAEVKVGGQTLLVEKSKLSLDGQPLGNLPPETKKVEVSVKEGMLSVVGDGKEFARAKLTPPPPQ